MMDEIRSLLRDTCTNISPDGLAAYRKIKADTKPFRQYSQSFVEQLEDGQYFEALCELTECFVRHYRQEEADQETLKRWQMQDRKDLADARRSLNSALAQLERALINSRIDFGFGDEPAPVPDSLRISDEEMAVVRSVVAKAIGLKEMECGDFVGSLPEPTTGRPKQTVKRALEQELADLFLATGMRQNMAAKLVSGVMRASGFSHVPMAKTIETRISSRKIK